MTKFDSSEEAVNLLNNVKGSIENKIRASFNIGYCKGYEDGNRNAIQELERALMNMTELKAEQTEPNCSEKPNNCEHITEDGVTCAKYPACDDCLDNPLNKVKGSERLLKGKDEPQIGEMMTEEEFDSMLARVLAGNNEPQTERSE